MYRFYLFYKVGSLLIFLNSNDLLIVLSFWMFFKLLSFLFAHLNSLQSEFLPNKCEIMIYFIKCHISCSDEFLSSISLFYGGHFIRKQKEHDQLRLNGNGKTLNFIHIDAVFFLEVINIIDFVNSIHNLVDISVLEI